ncbi:hypothetical protein HDR58_06430 [bacterium]|nr:hypothetical protein [bacterium]
MSNNILNPKGKIDSSTFVLNYIILTILYFLIGFFFYVVFNKNIQSLVYGGIFLFIVKLFIIFNYRKRFIDITDNVPLREILPIILTFCPEICASILSEIKTVSSLIVLLVILSLILVPALIIALVPSKDKD